MQYISEAEEHVTIWGGGAKTKINSKVGIVDSSWNST